MTAMPTGLITINLNVDLNELVSKTWKKFLGIFGEDAESLKLNRWLDENTRTAFLQSRDVQCIGMHDPILISEIYQPTRLVRERPKTVRDPEGGREWDSPGVEAVHVNAFLAQRQNLIITAGPGWGKTTFLHWVFLHFLLRESDGVLPLLVTLRRKTAIPDLEQIVEQLEMIQAGRQNGRILLLVDGYDEIATEERKRVSDLLIKFTVRNGGEYFLTCRDYYEIYDLKVPRFRIGEFTPDDQARFVGAFLRAYGSSANAEGIIRDLHSRGFSDLIRHPLLLTLASLVMSGSSQIRAQNVVSLIEAALSTLSLRWDQSKGITRENTTPLDGAARLKCLKRLAYTLPIEPVEEHRALGVVQKQIDLMRWEKIEPIEVLLEIERFYGIFVPVAGKWGFVHRSLQDFLAAQYWVETGQFARRISCGEVPMDSRTAFAGCLIEDATDVMELALKRKEGLPVFVEMLVNDPSFKHDRVVGAIVHFYEQYKGEHYYWRTDEKVECAVEDEFVSGASSKFLDYVVQTCASNRRKSTDTLAAYAIVELHRRHVPLSSAAYKSCKENYQWDKFVFDVRNRRSVRLVDVSHA